MNTDGVVSPVFMLFMSFMVKNQTGMGYHEEHEEHVEEMLELQPPWKTRIDRRCRLRDAGMLLNKRHDTRKFSQTLG